MPSVAPLSSGVERRRHPRQNLYLDAVVSGSHFGARPCKLRDFCPEGVYLAWHEASVNHTCTRTDGIVAHGDSVIVEFACERHASRTSYQLRARVARVLEGGIGLELVEPYPEAFSALQQLARQFRDEPSGDAPATDAALSRGQNSARSDLLARCKESVARHLTAWLPDFFRRADDHLFRGAQDAKTNAEQRALLDAIPPVRAAEKLTGARIINALAEQMARLGAPLGAFSCAPSADQTATLALVEKDELEDLLAAAEIVSKAETRYKQALFETEQRFSQLINRSVDKLNNPIGPPAVFNTFFNALTDLNLSGIQRRAVYGALEAAILPGLGSLYAEINGILAIVGLPSVAQLFSPGPRASLGRRPPEPGTPGAVSATSGTLAPALAPSQGEVPELPTAYGNAQAGDAYHTVRRLMSLHKELVRGDERMLDSPMAGHSPSTSALPPLFDTVAPYYDRTAVVKALPSLQREYQSQSLAGAHDFDFRARLLAMLRSQHDGAEKLLSQAEIDAIDMAGNLLTSIKQDELLSENLKSQIGKLQIPLHRVALVDPAFFSAPEHPVRQVLNRLAQLHMEAEGSGGIEAEGLRARLDELVERINGRFDQDSAVFPEVLEEIDRLDAARVQAYEQNVGRLVKECQDQEAFLRARRKPAAGGQSSVAPALPLSPDAPPEVRNEWELWLNRAKALRVKDVIVLKPASANPQRLVLAWIGEDYNPYVFVDPKGIKAASMTLQELAMLLRRGTATIVDQSALGLVDRALHGVLYKLHRQIGRHALHDPLTDLMNRKNFLGHLEQASISAMHGSTQYLLAHLRLGGIEPIVERYGSMAKEKLIRQVAALLIPQVHGKGVIGRIGDVDFGLLLQDCSEQDGYRLATTLIESIDKYCVQGKDEVFALITSIGLLPVKPEADGAEGLMRAAEASCLAAQQTSGAHIHIHQRLDLDLGQQTIDWQAWLDTVLESGSVEIYAQAIAPLEGQNSAGRCYGLQAGVLNEAGQLLRPETYLGGSELTAKLRAFDRLVIRQALAWIAHHSDVLEDALGYAITLSSESLKDEALVAYLIEQLFDSRVPPGKVCFEMAETAVIDNLPEAERLIQTLKEIGCRFSLSRFGRAEVSHAYLQRLSIDYLKVDGMFIKDIDVNEQDYAVVKSATEIGHLLGKKIIADEADKPSVLERLRELNVDYAQGAAIASPSLLKEVA